MDGLSPTGFAASSLGYGPDLDRLTRMGDDDEALRETAQKLEGVFVSMLTKTLRESMSGEGLFGGGPGADVYSGLFDQMMGDQIASRRGLGIAEMVVRSEMARRDAARSAESKVAAAAVPTDSQEGEGS